MPGVVFHIGRAAPGVFLSAKVMSAGIAIAIPAYIAVAGYIRSQLVGIVVRTE